METDNSLAKYAKLFTKLRRDYRNGGAPHKPVLLLSVLQLIERSDISSNRIYISPELVAAFRENWNSLVTSPKHVANFALPFFHMRSEPFWELFAKPGMEIAVTKSNSIRSFKNLKATLDYAQIDQELWILLNEPVARVLLRDTLLDTYFPASKAKFSSKQYELFVSQLSNELLEESSNDYKSKIENLKTKLDEEAYEEELFIRGGAFKKTIPRIYENTCCVSGLCVDATISASMIDACHIIPFSTSHDDTIQNGIALCPNLHRAFDRGLIAIDTDYKVLVSSSFIEGSDSTYSIKQFEGSQIFLPRNDKYRPSSESLNWHLKECFVR